MPVEIKELVIKAEFGGAREGAAAPEGADASAEGQDDLVQEVVRQVLEILDRKRER